MAKDGARSLGNGMGRQEKKGKVGMLENNKKAALLPGGFVVG
ncbi:hypothetical protein [Janthinobacterium sp.]|nr:hypothetical protein [Janthinobacterium sp.]MCX7293895.1 hypothetical protein [Janthinobacterium sp.]